MQAVRGWCGVLACCVLMMLLSPARAYPRYQPNYYWNEGDQLDPDEIEDMIAGLRNIIQLDRTSKSVPPASFYNSKRGLDLGLSRGYSGALQAKHLMGLAAANFAEGPGRRRRHATNDE